MMMPIIYFVKYLVITELHVEFRAVNNVLENRALPDLIENDLKRGGTSMRKYVTDVQAQALSETERRRRETADFARANVELEGFRISADEEEWTARFIRGEITIEAFIKGN